MTEPNKWALLIGIGEYLEYYPGAGKLPGCVNDARLMASILQSSFGFPVANTTLLLDADATRDGILAAIHHLAAQVREDDVAVIFYSGRSHYRTDPTGQWPADRISILAPHDYVIQPDPDRYITYEELGQRLIPLMRVTPDVTLIIDSSYSGTICPALDSDPSLHGRWLYLGACRTQESVHDIRLDEVWHGAFTYALGQTLVSAERDTTYRQVFEQVSSQVSARFPRQHPQMEGEGNRPLFAAGKVESTRFVPVTQRSRYMATLGAGAAHGMTAGSMWSVYPEDVHQVTPDMPKLGMVEISEVGAIESKAKVLSEVAAEAIAPGTKMIEEAHNFGEMRLPVDVRVASDDLERHAERLRKMFFESELLRSVDPGEQADVTAWLLPPRSVAGKNDPVPQLGALDQPTWALVVGSDRLLGPTYAIEDRSAVWELRDNLERLARTRNVLSLRNPNMNSALAGKVELSLERMSPDGTWAQAQPEAKSGMVVLEEGDCIRFVITNHYHAPLYVSILDFPWDGSFSLIFPTYGRNELDPKECIETEKLVVSIPDERSGKVGVGDESPAARVETAKLFATTYRTDFPALIRQGAMRGVQASMGEATMLWELLDMALTGHGSRRSRPVQLPAEQDWITIERVFAVSRKGGSRD